VIPHQLGLKREERQNDLKILSRASCWHVTPKPTTWPTVERN